MTLHSNPKNSGAHRRAQAGLTLLEVLAALAVIALSLLLVAPQFRGASDMASLDKTARILAATLNDARSRAVSGNEQKSVRIDLDAHVFLFGDEKVRSYPHDIDLKVIAAQSETPDASRPGFRFYPDGSATGGEIILSRDNVSMQVSVDWLTGAVDLERMEKAP